MARRRRALLLLVLGLALVACGHSPVPPKPAEASKAESDPPWLVASKKAKQALAAGDLAGYRARLLELYGLLSGSPTVVYKLAAAEARLGNTGAALDWLGTYADMGLTADVAADHDFDSVRALPAFTALAARLHDNGKPVSSSTLAFTLPNTELVAEDVAHDDAGHAFYVTSVRRRKILRVAEDGAVTDLAREGQDGLFSVLGAAADARRELLWVAVAAMPQAANYDSHDAGKTSLYAYDLTKGALARRVELPADAANAHALTDLTLAPGGEVVASDALGAMVYLVRGDPRLRAPSVEVLSTAGTFVSPQTPAVTADGARVLVADYVRGIASIDLATKTTTWLTHPKNVALSGIDGLYFASPTVLLAVQNGVEPPRVVRFYADAGLTRIERLDVVEQATPGLGEPTHGVIVGATFYFIANSGWDQLDDAGAVKLGGMRNPPEIWKTAALRAP
jgi:hypothetical protein